MLASGDPTFHGIGTTLVRLLGADAVRVIPQPSSVSLGVCAARLAAGPGRRWSAWSANPVERLHPHLHPGRRVLILSRGAQTPAEVADLLTARGYGASEFTVLEQLGGPAERVRTTNAADWSHDVDPLNVIAVLCPLDGPPSSQRHPACPTTRTRTTAS